MNNSTPSKLILLVEPQFVLRRTIVAVSRDLGLAELLEATSIEAGMSKLATTRFDGLVIAVDNSPAVFNLLSRLRHGDFPLDTGIPVIALTTGNNELLDARLESFGVLATLPKPFKVAELLKAIKRMTEPVFERSEPGNLSDVHIPVAGTASKVEQHQLTRLPLRAH